MEELAASSLAEKKKTAESPLSLDDKLEKVWDILHDVFLEACQNSEDLSFQNICNLLDQQLSLLDKPIAANIVEAIKCELEFYYLYKEEDVENEGEEMVFRAIFAFKRSSVSVYRSMQAELTDRIESAIKVANEEDFDFSKKDLVDYLYDALKSFNMDPHCADPVIAHLIQNMHIPHLIDFPQETENKILPLTPPETWDPNKAVKLDENFLKQAEISAEYMWILIGAIHNKIEEKFNTGQIWTLVEHQGLTILHDLFPNIFLYKQAERLFKKCLHQIIHSKPLLSETLGTADQQTSLALAAKQKISIPFQSLPGHQEVRATIENILKKNLNQFLPPEKNPLLSNKKNAQESIDKIVNEIEVEIGEVVKAILVKNDQYAETELNLLLSLDITLIITNTAEDIQYRIFLPTDAEFEYHQTGNNETGAIDEKLKFKDPSNPDLKTKEGTAIISNASFN